MSDRNQSVSLQIGAGGRAMRDLVQNVFVRGRAPGLETPGTIGLAALDDGAAVPVGDRWLVLTTDSHVIQPVFFPGGDIGRLSVAGTVNDLAMMGATEVLGLTCGMILEEGYPLADLLRIQDSVRATCEEARAPILTGDTKVMRRGEIDGIVINTSGVAFADRVVSDAGLRLGDLLVVSGTVGDHGLAVLAARDELGLESDLASDVAPLGGLVRDALAAAAEGIVAMKDPTRGGLASALNEMAEKSGVGIELDERAVPVDPAARSASELLGIDPLHVANEGKAVFGVAPEALDDLMSVLHGHPLGKRAAVVGRCVDERRGQVVLNTGFGRRLLVEPEGELLPRIC